MPESLVISLKRCSSILTVYERSRRYNLSHYRSKAGSLNFASFASKIECGRESNVCQSWQTGGPRVNCGLRGLSVWLVTTWAKFICKTICVTTCQSIIGTWDMKIKLFSVFFLPSLSAAQSDRKLLKLSLNVAGEQEPAMIKRGERMGKRGKRRERERMCELFFGHYHFCTNTVAYRSFFVRKK